MSEDGNGNGGCLGKAKWQFFGLELFVLTILWLLLLAGHTTSGVNNVTVWCAVCKNFLRMDVVDGWATCPKCEWLVKV